MNIPPPREQGAALLSVLLLVAIMATIAATALDRVSLSTRLAANALGVAQSRSWLGAAGLLATTRIEDLRAANRDKTLPTGWLGVERTLPLPNGAVVRARVEDGGNCFNLNSLVQRTGDGRLVSRPAGLKQFAALMTSLGIDAGKAARIAASASDYIDADSYPILLGSEDGTDVTPPNQLMADASELRAVANVGASEYDRLRGWTCALPTTDMSPLNINTLLPTQAPLVAMLNPGRLDPGQARTALAMRPASGYANASEFWQLPVFAKLPPPLEAADQLRTTTDFFRLVFHQIDTHVCIQHEARLHIASRSFCSSSPRPSAMKSFPNLANFSSTPVSGRRAGRMWISSPIRSISTSTSERSKAISAGIRTA